MFGTAAINQALPHGVRFDQLAMHQDERGVFTELFRHSWHGSPAPVQWNMVRSNANVLRGVHVHLKHWDYLTLVDGHATFALKDLRTGSPTFGLTSIIEATAEHLTSIVIPPGVAHGFYFHLPSCHVYAVSEYWDKADELGCYFSDRELEIDWPCREPLLSERDRSLGSLQELLPQVQPWVPDISSR